MREPEYEELMELSWRRCLSPAEQARLERHLAANPAARAEWELEQRLNRALAEMPPAPVSSNFTARVLQAARRTEPKKVGWLERIWRLRPRGLLPRFAVSLLTVSAMLLFSAHEYQQVNRARTARTLASVSRVANLPEIEWLQDFDTIRQISRVEVADTELLSALQ